jgi:hypothetical protein
MRKCTKSARAGVKVVGHRNFEHARNSREKSHVHISHIHWENHIRRVYIEKSLLRHLKVNRGATKPCVQSNLLV